MDTVFSHCKKRILLQLVTCLTLMVIMANAKIKGTFKCTQRPRREITCYRDDLPKVMNGDFQCPSTSVERGGECTLTCTGAEAYPFPSNQTICRATNSENGGEWFPHHFSCSIIDCSQWNEWNGSEYKFIDQWSMRKEAHRLCGSDNAHLVTIKNQEENDFVYKVVKRCSHINSAWIGLNDLGEEGMWEWSDGTVSTYRNWAYNQPDNGEASNCVVIKRNSGKWNDYSCNQRRYAVCERKKTY